MSREILVAGAEKYPRRVLGKPPVFLEGGFRDVQIDMLVKIYGAASERDDAADHQGCQDCVGRPVFHAGVRGHGI